LSDPNRPPVVTIINDVTTPGWEKFFFDNWKSEDGSKLSSEQVNIVSVNGSSFWEKELRKAQDSFRYTDSNDCEWPTSHYIISIGWSDLWRSGSETLVRDEEQTLSADELYTSLNDELEKTTNLIAERIYQASGVVAGTKTKGGFRQFTYPIETAADIASGNFAPPKLVILTIPPWGEQVVGTSGDS